MLEMIKKIFSVLSAFPAFTNVFRKAASTGKVDPVDTLNALSSLSPGTKKASDNAMNAMKNGGNIADGLQAAMNTGEIEVLGQKINTKTMIGDLERAGGICSIFANILKKMPNQSEEEIVNFGNAASDTSNWNDFINKSDIKS